ncbi:hypothetical protein N180_00025 [Pedobacter antarcticus 4BY]|uniref:Lipoprotein n=2 Tax=Pedobacter antarcticus TaxID=34086 RepID=A0A081PBI9_9SPHI|nr:hypothetical protein [Pedobacter antarcticus]KEQ28062.1 hypothetical protein N180_00025 [Pedobacter antarcticus 4BY]SFE40533.1 hypothetical protein SAMN03003324_00369 [Pedobacter antarcticus]
MVINKPSGLICSAFLLINIFSACRNSKSDAQAAFYYWKTDFNLTGKQQSLLKEVAANRLYVRFFDVVWDTRLNQSVPRAVLKASDISKDLKIIPVVYLTNQVFESTKKGPELDSLASRVNREILHLAEKAGVNYEEVQIDCDWTVSTRPAYFSFLSLFRKYTGKKLSATIRLHQVKYPERTGIPPVDKGILMFYNMGKISADPKLANSIYNIKDASRYLQRIRYYHLPLDVALPLFSWTLQIREGKVIQLYAKITRKELSDADRFTKTKYQDVYRARKSFFTGGVYIKENDLLKLEEINKNTLKEAALQLTSELAVLKKRNIIYYELSSENAADFDAKDLQEISSYF